MGASDHNQDLGPGLAKGVTSSQLQHSQQRAAVEREQADAWIACLAILAGAILLVVGYYVVRGRRKIARAADAALVSGLATGVRAVRAARSSKDALANRVLARADETSPPRD